MKALFLALLAIFTQSSAFAGPLEQIEATFNACVDRAANRGEIEECNSAAHAAADAEMNRVYQTWLRQLDPTCASPERAGASGSGYSLCMYQETVERIRYIESYN